MRKIQNSHVKIAVIAVVAGAALYAIISAIDNIGLVWTSVTGAVNFVLRILAPVITGFIIAFLLNRPSDFFSRIIQKIKFFGRRSRLADSIGVLCAFVSFIAIMVLFIYLMVPGIISSVSSITRDIPSYAQQIDSALQDLSRNQSLAQVFSFIGIDITKANSISSILSEFWTDITAFFQGAAAYLFGFIVNTGLFLYNFVLGLFFSVYMLLFKKEIKGQLATLSKNVFRKSHYKLMFILDIADDMFYKFLVGKGICSIAIGVLAFAACSIAGIKYAPLISLIIALTNMIPTFGPFIGAVPALLLALMTGPVYVLYMLIIIIGLQFVEANILSPRILGSSMGINAFWIMFSIIVMGALFGVLGMLIAAPLFGLLRILIKNWIYHRQHGSLEGEAEAAASKQRFIEWTAKKKSKVSRDSKKASSGS